ncbi:hypothetical protein ACJX0J_023885, partial [Zea mays]
QHIPLLAHHPIGATEEEELIERYGTTAVGYIRTIRNSSVVVVGRKNLYKEDNLGPFDPILLIYFCCAISALSTFGPKAIFVIHLANITNMHLQILDQICKYENETKKWRDIKVKLKQIAQEDFLKRGTLFKKMKGKSTFPLTNN